MNSGQKAMKLVSICVIIICCFCNNTNADDGDVIGVDNGIVICNEENIQSKPKTITDGNGGVIVVWNDLRNDNGDIYADRLDSDGNSQWAENGIPISAVQGLGRDPLIISDNNNGAVIVWHDRRNDNWDIYAQRVDGNGNILWLENGIPIITQQITTGYKVIIDSNNDIFIVWNGGFDADRDVYVQKIDLNGNIKWGEGAVQVFDLPDDQFNGGVVSDGEGGVIVVWDERIQAVNSDIRAQRIDGNGNLLWQIEGLPVCTARNGQFNAVIVSDANGGAIISWIDIRTGGINGPLEIYAQRIGPEGAVQWAENGIPVCLAGGDKYNLKSISTSNNGAIIVWDDYRNFFGNIYAQKIDVNGNILWIENGTKVCTAELNQFNDAVVSDNNGGAIIVWEDWQIQDDVNIYAQKIDHNGNRTWGDEAEGLAICTADGEQRFSDLISNINGGTTIVWQDARLENNNIDIYGQRVEGAGDIIVPDISNMGFERGDLTDWMQSDNIQGNIRNADVKNNLEGEILPAEGNFMGFISNIGKAKDEEVILISPWIRVPDDASHVSYRWNILTDERPTRNNQYNDTMIVRKEVEGGGAVNAAFMRVNNLNFPEHNIAGFNNATGWKNSSNRVIHNRGQRIRYYFAVENIGDGSVETAVLLDDIRIR